MNIQEDLPLQLEEVVQPDALEQQEQPIEQVQAQPQDQPQERNLRAMREIKERAERERDEALRRIREMEASRYQQQPDHVHEDEEDFSLNVKDDDLAEGKHLKAILKEQKRISQQMKQYAANSAAMQLRSEYPDFDRVVTKDNMKILQDLDPYEANSILYNPDVYTQGLLAYRRIKEKGIFEEDASYAANKQLIARNQTKPRSVSSVSPQQGNSPLSQANAFSQGLTPELKAQLFKEMEEARKGY